MNKYLAEGFGTLFLVLVTAGSVLANAQSGTNALGLTGLALAHALGLAAIIYATWHISGAHLNPAITVTQAITGHIEPLTALGYIVSQLLGSLGGAIILKFLFVGVTAQAFLGDVQVGPNISPITAVVAEAVFTFMLTWIFYGACVAKKSASGFGGLAVGFLLGAAVLVIGQISGAALNPARSFGPAFISMHWTNHFIYWIGPLLGAIMSGVLYHFVVEKTK